ncbi:peptidoglycan-binding domain-containing protein [Microvirga lotononidis]|uniref:Putative peptidoglycan-binding domain-containing protein n=1 Tax=Microvirga lotononidis TaxID=864069 RepID=I4YWV6_9HYPH|nr:peptidoglycan-binding domain-containing protein [Microvirga lotononidis]EIM28448.1 putative peptidoglycan-binding domain-containing protein [Microvirga lotononidis]WQO29914.1 peptidoglycan-binding domain-containing protein [Microvirga lotononidis]
MMNRLTIAIAVAGWALYGFSVLMPRSSGADPQAEIARLRQVAETAGADRDALAAELVRFKEGNRDLQHVQNRIAATTQELKHLEYLRSRISGEIDVMRPQPSKAPSQAVAPPESSILSDAAGAGPSKDEIGYAQQALTALGFGPLKADGVFGPGTRRAVEAFQQARGLPVTGKLEAATLRAIQNSHVAVQP